MLKLTSESTHQISGYGTVKVIKNPGRDNPLWREVLASRGEEIEIDGERFILRNIDLAIPLVYPVKKDAMAYCSTWGLAVRKINET